MKYQISSINRKMPLVAIIFFFFLFPSSFIHNVQADEYNQGTIIYEDKNAAIFSLTNINGILQEKFSFFSNDSGNFVEITAFFGSNEENIDVLGQVVFEYDPITKSIHDIFENQFMGYLPIFINKTSILQPTNTSFTFLQYPTENLTGSIEEHNSPIYINDQKLVVNATHIYVNSSQGGLCSLFYEENFGVLVEYSNSIFNKFPYQALFGDKIITAALNLKSSNIPFVGFDTSSSKPNFVLDIKLILIGCLALVSLGSITILYLKKKKRK